MNDDRETPSGCFSPERLCAFSDGVLAIVITILVLGIEVPEGHDFANEGFFSFLAKSVHDIVIYAASFWLVGAYWILHHTIFSFVRFANRHLLLLNLLFLFITTLAPFSMKLKSAYPHDLAALANLAAVHIVVGWTLIAMWRYILRHPELRWPTLNLGRAHLLTRRILFANLVAVGTCLVGILDVRVATVLFLLVPVAYLLHTAAKLRSD